MAYGFNGDKSKFDIDAALIAAIKDARSIEWEKNFSSLQDFEDWVLSLPDGYYAVTTNNTVSISLGLPWNNFSLIRVYKANINSITVFAQNISRASVTFGLECAITKNFTWGSWQRLFDDILPGDVVSMGSENVAWAGKGLNTSSFRVTVPMGRKIRANSCAVSGNVSVACIGTLVAFKLNDRPTTPSVQDLYYNTASAVLSKKTNSVIVQVNFDIGGDLVRADYLMLMQNDTTSSNKLTFTFS